MLKTKFGLQKKLEMTFIEYMHYFSTYISQICVILFQFNKILLFKCTKIIFTSMIIHNHSFLQIKLHVF